MHVLGINSVFHESAACLLADGEMVAAAEEERFNRIKHAKTPQVDNPHSLPLQAMAWCLETAGIDLRQVDHVGYSCNPDKWLPHKGKRADRANEEFVRNVRQVPGILRTMGFAGEFHFIDHHTAHAASAFFPSPFDSAAVLTVDGIGDGNTTAGYRGDGSQLNLVTEVPSPHSIGFLWELTSMFLGFGIYDATKIMGLSAYGDPARFEEQYRVLIRKRPEGQFRVDRARLRFWELDYYRQTGYFKGLEEVFGIPKRERDEELSQEHYDLAAALQNVTDDVLLHVVRHLHEKTQLPNLCLAGGVALNCVSNCRVFEQGPFEQVFIQPAAHDAGTALGAAMQIQHHLLGNERGEPMQNAYLGPEFSPSQIEDALRRHGLKATRYQNVEREVAEVLSRGEIVSYLQGRMEIGPRALGNRSLLADPRNPNMRDILNAKVKHREFFRPFAPSVLDEEAERWFQIGRRSPASEFMLMAYPVQEAVRDQIPAVVHADGTCRIQTVRKEANPRYHRLISEFQKLTGVPIVLNTSFNDSEPIVCSPDDAIDTFLKTSIDYLAMGDYLVAKTDNNGAQRGGKRRSAGTFDRVFPELQSRFETTAARLRVNRPNGQFVLTDSQMEFESDAVAPLFRMQQFLLDELPQDMIRGASILDLYAGSGALSLAAAKAGAKRVVALEPNPRARSMAGFNAVLNGCEDAVELHDQPEDLFSGVAGERFDGVICNAPFEPAANGSGESRFGLRAVQQILESLDAHLTPNGFAGILTLAPGGAEGPAFLAELAEKYLAGATTIMFACESKKFPALLDGMVDFELIDLPSAEAIKQEAVRDGLTHCHLCLIRYDAGKKKNVALQRAETCYTAWHEFIPGVELGSRRAAELMPV